MGRTFLPTFALLVGAGCAGGIGDPPLDERPWALTPVRDENPEPDVVEVNLVARASTQEIVAGAESEMWTYNDKAPGPIIEANLGDRVVVHFRNELDEPTTIHWHGLRIPAEMDGVLAMQSPVGPGEEFTYDFIVKDALLAWYHPHVRSDVQVERGLQAAFVVRDPEGLQFGRETIAVLDDLTLDERGRVTASASGHMAMASGNTIVVNGHRHPVLQVSRGEPQLLRLVNTSNSTTMTLSLPGRRLTWIGSDGGLFERAVDVDTLTLSPGERGELVFALDDAPGAETDLVARTGDDGMLRTNETNILRLRVVDGDADPFAAIPDSLNEIQTLTPQRSRTIAFTGGMMPMMGDGMHEFGFNGDRWPNVTPLDAHTGDVEEWTLDNQTGVAHPFHLHGNRFQVIEGLMKSLPVAGRTMSSCPRTAECACTFRSTAKRADGCITAIFSSTQRAG